MKRKEIMTFAVAVLFTLSVLTGAGTNGGKAFAAEPFPKK